MHHYKNLSLESITENIDGIIYKEEWIDIKGYEGHFQISSFGRIKSLERIVMSSNPRYSKQKLYVREKIRKQVKTIKGYLLCVLRHPNKKMKGFAVHRLVGLHFVPNLLCKPEINHKKGIKTDNRFFMLEWVTSKENTHHSRLTGLQKPLIGKDNKKSIPVYQYDRNGYFIREFSNAREAFKITGISNTQIGQVCLGRLKSAHGFFWSHKKQHQ